MYLTSLFLFGIDPCKFFLKNESFIDGYKVLNEILNFNYGKEANIWLFDPIYCVYLEFTWSE